MLPKLLVAMRQARSLARARALRSRLAAIAMQIGAVDVGLEACSERKSGPRQLTRRGRGEETALVAMAMAMEEPW